ncbi:hypothetical protein [Rathayibacter rathayi]|uniref:hypothetical protein n=1 Tax=Rathayibacter rathayi TaxID=33887 RepID=UPI000CE929F2|nr:hypothetical protein [Rathayibacter rathayi]PPG14403.1 hypothetical protein C5C11_05030 [Rathayibacter rathayi]
MNWLSNLFDRDGLVGDVAGNGDVEPLPAPATAEAPIDALERLVRTAAPALSTTAYSLARRLDDVLRPLIAHTSEHPPLTEQRLALDYLVEDFVPTAVRLYVQLRPEDRGLGSRADELLVQQLETLLLNARMLSDTIHADALAALATHAIFVDTTLS